MISNQEVIDDPSLLAEWCREHRDDAVNSYLSWRADSTEGVWAIVEKPLRGRIFWLEEQLARAESR